MESNDISHSTWACLLYGQKKLPCFAVVTSILFIYEIPLFNHLDVLSIAGKLRSVKCARYYLIFLTNLEH